MRTRRLIYAFQPLIECCVLFVSSLFYLPLAVVHAVVRLLYPTGRLAVRSPKCIGITGASSGIGAALAIRYSRPGITVAITGRNEHALEAVAAECRKRGADARTTILDVRDPCAVRKWIDETDDVCPLDIIVSNAGTTVGLCRDSLGSNASDSEIATAVHAVNITGTINTVYAALDRMKDHKRGQIAVVGSVSADARTAGNYAASKAAVRTLAISLRSYARPHGVGVSLIEPGWVTSKLAKDIGGQQPFIMCPEEAAEIIEDSITHADVHAEFPLGMFLIMRMLAALPLAIYGLFPIPFLAKALPPQVQL